MKRLPERRLMLPRHIIMGMLPSCPVTCTSKQAGWAVPADMETRLGT